jgi:hypothetical protein
MDRLVMTAWQRFVRPVEPVRGDGGPRGAGPADARRRRGAQVEAGKAAAEDDDDD